MLRSGNRKLIGHHHISTSSQLITMMRQPTRKDIHASGCNSITNLRSSKSEVLGKYVARPSLDQAPRLLRYLGGSYTSCPHCGLEVESDVDMSCACSECRMKIQGAVEKPKTDQKQQQAQEQRQKSADNPSACVDDQPCKIIVLQEGESNQLIHQLTAALNRALNLAASNSKNQCEPKQQNCRKAKECCFQTGVNNNNADQSWEDERNCEYASNVCLDR